MKIEAEAGKTRVENVNDIDLHRLEISRVVFEKIYKNEEKFNAKYGNGDEGENALKYESVLETMRRRKLELECQRKMK